MKEFNIKISENDFAIIAKVYATTAGGEEELKQLARHAIGQTAQNTNRGKQQKRKRERMEKEAKRRAGHKNILHKLVVVLSMHLHL